MRDHHQVALDRAVERLKLRDDISLVLLGGSIAKGLDRSDSDVDLIVVVSDQSYTQLIARNAASFLWTDVADWEGGYVEGRFVSREFVLSAAIRGSEPTRWSFTGAKPVWGSDPDIEDAAIRIPVYPEWDRDRRIDAFLAQLTLCRGYFWHESVRLDDPYLKAWSASRVVLFAGRLILAHDRILFPNQKRLMETVASCPSKPVNFEDLARRTLAGDEEARDRLWQHSVHLVGKRDIDLLISRFQQDSEMSWFLGSHDVGEW